MSRIFISGSSTGLGLMAAELLVQQGHQVVLHARNANRAEEAHRALPQAEAVFVGDLETIEGARQTSLRVNALGRVAGVMCVVTASSLAGCRQRWGGRMPRDQAHLTQAWLAASRDTEADVTGKYFYHMKRMTANPQAHDVALQDRLINICTEISGIALPE
ncbi:SDR family NAD(P)-dependent oxidoreductase [Enterobacter sp. 18A13]|uniref:SDR family NAD(P)-dependent oxidoreductase n=1 Tax=Enterobacter sp. 18A13 TaxID=2565914 RepID=UPI0010CA6240|nr:SDR family NAD(P)-dependent oxidoreductase [Enterobacter sp. 18A13]BBJ67546.1 hypothetical protein ECC18A13_021110 [Enterobacter sp. 18A13]